MVCPCSTNKVISKKLKEFICTKSKKQKEKLLLLTVKNLPCGFLALFILMAVFSIFPILVKLDWRINARCGKGGGEGGGGSGGSKTGLCLPQRPILSVVLTSLLSN